MRFLAAFGVSLGLATSALASGPYIPYDPPVTPPPPVAYDWSGYYAGAVIGASQGEYRQGVSALNQLGAFVDVDGATGGLLVGRNWQSSGAVFGLEFDASIGPSGVTPQFGPAGPDWFCNTGDCTVDIQALFTLRGRVGMARDNWLFYGTAGIAHARVEGGIIASAQFGSGTATGYVAGLGAEYGISARSSIRAEYLYYDLGELPFGTDGGANRFDADGTFSTLRVGYNYRF
jgi:outer membrane immunogenic protein